MYSDMIKRLVLIMIQFKIIYVLLRLKIVTSCEVHLNYCTRFIVSNIYGTPLCTFAACELGQTWCASQPCVVRMAKHRKIQQQGNANQYLTLN